MLEAQPVFLIRCPVRSVDARDHARPSQQARKCPSKVCGLVLSEAEHREVRQTGRRHERVDQHEASPRIGPRHRHDGVGQQEACGDDEVIVLVRAGLQRAPVFRWTRRDDEPGPGTGTVAHRIADTPPSVRIARGLQARDIGNERDPEFGRAPRRGRGGGIDAGSGPAGAGLYEDQQAGNEDEDAGSQVPNRRSP